MKQIELLELRMERSVKQREINCSEYENNSWFKLGGHCRVARATRPAARLAFIDDLNIVAVRIKHPGRIIARIVFGPRLR